MKTKFTQITKVELKLANLYNTLGKTTFCAWRHVICYRSFAKVTSLLDHFQCHCAIVRQRFCRNVDCTAAGNIETMSFEMRRWSWIRDT